MDIGGYEDHNEGLITNVIVGEKERTRSNNRGGVWNDLQGTG